MGATLWHGQITAQRYTMACPRCGRAGATTDCDTLGRTTVACSCSPVEFLMPLSIGGTGMAWPIDLTGYAEDEPDPSSTDRRCATDGCDRWVQPRAVHCSRCAVDRRAKAFPCPDCSDGTMGFRAKRCKACARAKHYRECAAQMRAKRKEAKG